MSPKKDKLSDRLSNPSKRYTTEDKVDVQDPIAAVSASLGKDADTESGQDSVDVRMHARTNDSVQVSTSEDTHDSVPVSSPERKQTRKAASVPTRKQERSAASEEAYI